MVPLCHSNPLLNLEPVPALIARVRTELPGDFGAARPIRISRAPGRLDVMGGIADYTGSLVCELPLDRAAAAVMQEREDRDLVIYSFNLRDENKPFAFRIGLDKLASEPAEVLRQVFAHSTSKWAAYVVGCLFVLHEKQLIDLRDPGIKGLSIAIRSTVPLGAGVSSSAAIEVAAMMLFRDHFDLAGPAAGRSLRIAGSRAANGQHEAFTPLKLAALCQTAQHRIVGAPSGIVDQVASCLGKAGQLFRMVCQPHEIQPDLAIPAGMQVVGINSNVRHEVGGAYGRTRCAAFMGHKIMLQMMREFGEAGGRRLVADPMRGYLANLDPDDYKRLFRPRLPEMMLGSAFLEKFSGTIDTATSVDPQTTYAIQHAADHHVLEARRVRNFAGYLEQANLAPEPRVKGSLLDRAGHLMYASHQSYTMDAMLGAPECDLLVKLVRQRERAGLYGAKITGSGSGGTVAVLCETNDRANAAIAEVMEEYEKQTSQKPELFAGTSPGAWHLGTTVVS